MHTITAKDPRYNLLDTHSIVPELPRPLHEKLLIELPRPSTETETGIYIGAETSQSMQMIPDQYLVLDAPDDCELQTGDVIQAPGHAIQMPTVFKDDDGTTRVFAYMKFEHAAAVVPLSLSMFHERVLENAPC